MHTNESLHCHGVHRQFLLPITCRQTLIVFTFVLDVLCFALGLFLYACTYACVLLVCSFYTHPARVFSMLCIIIHVFACCAVSHTA